MVDITAARRDVDDARSLAGHNVSSSARITATVDHSVTRLAAAVFEFLINRVAAGLLLNGEVVEGTVVFPADHLGTFDRADFFEAAVLFEYLSQRLQLRNVLRPLPLRTPESFFEFFRQAFEVQVLFGEVVNRSVAFGF